MRRDNFIFLFICNITFSQSFLWLGSMGTPYAEVHGISADGRVVAGWAGVSSPHYAFRWTPDSGMRSIGSLNPEDDAEAWGMSADGNVIVGVGDLPGAIYRGFRWKNDTMYQLGTFGGGVSWAYGSSFNGSVVVGSAETLTGFNRAFHWQQDSGMRSLGVLPGAIRSVARAVSLDGRIVVGWSGFSNQVHHAFRWENGQMMDIHNSQFGQSEALGVSGDGNVVVGACAPLPWIPTWAFRWSATTGMETLGTLGGEWSEAWAANYDGSIVVGWAERSPGNWGAFRWTEQNGMEDLNTVYANLLPPGSILRDAMAISPDGRFIAGRGYNPQTGRDEAYLLDTGISLIANQSITPLNPQFFSISPNPFKKASKIFYEVSVKSPVQISIYDATGREIARLIDEVKEAGRYQFEFDGRNFSEGAYICRLKSGRIVSSHVFTIIK
jgi:probable HAF family extracellular repeat protein|uniref:T9SS type A sorting domain-containing protein n=1 Tax=candidate division WOR-3 bacterium TaxID=2052148 RepID=A0A7C3UPB7_UNCW3